MLKVKITIEQDDKKAEIELSEADKLSKLVIIENVFKLFGVDTDILEMTRTYNEIGKRYASFFNEVNPIEPIQEEIVTIERDIKHELIQGLTQNQEELKSAYETIQDQAEHRYTGIKEVDGKKRYQLRYHCPACWNRGTHFIPPDAKKTWCHRCQHELIVFPATTAHFHAKDRFSNFFRAGDYEVQDPI